MQIGRWGVYIGVKMSESLFFGCMESAMISYVEICVYCE